MYSSHPIVQFGPPFLSVDEAVFVVPKKGEVRLERSHFKVLFVLSGQTEYEIDGLEGRRWLKTGDILVVPVTVRHVFFNRDPHRAAPMQVVRLFLDADHLRERACKRSRKPETDLSDYILHHFTRIVQISGGIDNEITQLLTTFRHETEHHGIGYRHRIHAICTELIVAVTRKLKSDHGETGPRRGSSQLVAAAKEYILKHLGNQMTLGEIAWHVGKGEEHLARVFKRETGESVFDYVREMRVNKAKTDLLEPGLSLTKVAERCGFNSLSFFSRTFRQCAGMSPSEYRKHIG